jgi:hypothetical protein
MYGYFVGTHGGDHGFAGADIALKEAIHRGGAL